MMIHSHCYTSTLLAAAALAGLSAASLAGPPSPPPPKPVEQPLLSFFDGKVVFDIQERVRWEIRENNFDFNDNVRSLTDEAVQPQGGKHPTSALEGASNIVIQDVCPGRTTTHVGTAAPAKTAALREARKANEAKDASLQRLEAESPSPSAKPTKAPKTPKAPKVAKAPKTDRTAFSAAVIIREFGYTGKIGRALLRKHNVARTPEAIRAFFKSRTK